MNLQRITRFQFTYRSYLRKLTPSKFNSESKHTINNNWTSKFNIDPQICSYYSITPYAKLYSTSAMSDSQETVDANIFEKVCEETLESLTDFFEELVESNEILKNADVSYSDGVLTINLGNKLGTYVINRQSPNRQIWLSSPTSGPKRYDFVVNGNFWIYRHDMVSLHKLLESELSTILKEKVDFSKCKYSKV